MKTPYYSNRLADDNDARKANQILIASLPRKSLGLCAKLERVTSKDLQNKSKWCKCILIEEGGQRLHSILNLISRNMRETNKKQHTNTVTPIRTNGRS